jgi:hypothetical protein
LDAFLEECLAPSFIEESRIVEAALQYCNQIRNADVKATAVIVLEALLKKHLPFSQLLVCENVLAESLQALILEVGLEEGINIARVFIHQIPGLPEG